MIRSITLAVAILIAGLAADSASADVLLIQRVQAASTTTLPVRGQTMAQVRAAFGSPQSELQPRGGQQPNWPIINRWVYPKFIVYFENERVINTVLVRTRPDERGPKPIE